MDDDNLKKIEISSTENKLLKEINTLELKTSQIAENLIPTSHSQANITTQILKKLKNKDKVFIGSSTIIRTFDQFTNKKNIDSSSKISNEKQTKMYGTRNSFKPIKLIKHSMFLIL